MSEPIAAPVESVDRALILLSALYEGATLSVTDAAARLGVAGSTAHRLLNALVHRGFAVQNSDRRYALGPTFAPREGGFLSLGSIRALAHPMLERLHEQSGETVHLMMLRHRSIRFVDGIESDRRLRVGVRVNDEMPAHCSAGGKAILAELSEADLEHLYPDGLPPWPTATITDLAELRRQLAIVRQSGFGTNQDETEQGVSGVGMAVRDARGRPTAAFTIAVPSSRFTDELIPEFREELAAATSALEAELRNATQSER